MATKQATVYFSVGGSASATVEVDIPDGAEPDEYVDEAIEQASQELDVSLCWRCAGKVATGDPEPTEVTIDGETVWEEQPLRETYATDDAGKAAVDQFREALIKHFRTSESQTLGLHPYSGDLIDAWCDTIADFQPPA